MDTRFYLDQRSGKSGKGIPLKIVIAHKTKSALLNTGIKLQTPEQWNETARQVENHPNARELNRFISTLKVQVDDIIQRVEYTREVDLSDPTAVKHLIEEELDPAKKEKRLQAQAKKADELLFISRFDKFMARHTESTQRLYKSTRSRLEQWLGAKLNRVKFEDITVAWLQDFDDFLRPFAPKPNGRSVHFRNIRAVFNDAIDHEITTNYPFRRFKIKHNATRKRSLKVEAFREIINAEYLDEWTKKYRDFFVLSFCLTGMNVIDLCGLKEIEDGRANFERAKTHRLYSIKVEPEALAYIENLKGKDWLLYPLDQNKNYRYYYTHLCAALKEIRNKINSKSDETGIKLPELTSYWARHTWATIASSIDIPKDTIAHALGHGNNTVTDIYIDFDQKKVDDANRKVLDYVFHDIDWRNPPVLESKPKRGRPKKAE